MYLIFAFAVVAAAPVEPAGIGRLVRGASPAVVSVPWLRRCWMPVAPP